MVVNFFVFFSPQYRRGIVEKFRTMQLHLQHYASVFRVRVKVASSKSRWSVARWMMMIPMTSRLTSGQCYIRDVIATMTSLFILVAVNRVDILCPFCSYNGILSDGCFRAKKVKSDPDKKPKKRPSEGGHGDSKAKVSSIVWSILFVINHYFIQVHFDN